MKSLRMVTLTLLLGIVSVSQAAAQDRPRIIINSTSHDTILAALRAECEKDGLKFIKADKHRAIFALDAGNMPVRNEMAPVRLETSFHFEDAGSATKIVITEELVATLKGGYQERRYPNGRERAKGYADLLSRTKARVEYVGTPPQDSGSSGSRLP